MADVKWIKITTDIFDDEKILLIESMPDSYAVITVWFKLLCLAGKQNNKGVFIMNNRIAYTDDMLATIFRMNKNTVSLALQTFEQFGMIERINGTITIPNWEKHQNIEGLERIREQSRKRVERHREKQKLLSLNDCNVTSNVTVTECNAIEEDKNKNKNKKKNNNKEYFSCPELNKAFLDFMDMRKKMKSPMTDRAVELAIAKLNKMSGGDDAKAIEIVNQSVVNGWKSFYELKNQQKEKKNSFKNCPERNYDFADYERKLLGG